MQMTIQVYHWMTTSYAAHKASDQLYKNILEIIDKFVEVHIGRYGRPQTLNADSFRIRKMTDQTFVIYLRNCATYLESNLVEHLKPSDTDLFSIRDELVGTIHQCLYLLSMH